jgi:predicted alpha/beta-hydrolase family hydrolase
VRVDAALAPPWIALGGRSLGARVASHLPAEGLAVRGLVFLAFPLHPAGRPGTTRGAHLPSITTPMLFVQGTRDALAEWSLLEPLVRSLPAATLHAVAGADHALAVRARLRAPESVGAEIEQTVVSWLRARGD